jgi:hypothetical protein
MGLVYKYEREQGNLLPLFRGGRERAKGEGKIQYTM